MAQSEQVESGEQSEDHADCSPAPPPSSGSRWSLVRSPQVGRKTVELAPSRSFSPTAEEVLRWSTNLAVSTRQHHRDFLRIHLRADRGQLSYLLNARSDLLTNILRLLPAGLTVREPTEIPATTHLSVARTVVTLPRSPRALPEDPDVLGDFARAISGVAEDELAEVILDLAAADMPPSRGHSSRSGLDFGMLAAAVTGNVRYSPSAVQRPASATPAASRPAHDLFLRVAVHTHAFSRDPERSRDLAVAVAQVFHAWGPGDSVRVSTHSPAGAWLYEGHYPRRRHSRVVSQAALAPLLLPPTESCTAPNVRRTPASTAVSAKLLELGPDVWPLGTPEGFSEPVGIPASGVLFVVEVGKPVFGKTSDAMTKFGCRTLPWPGTDALPEGGAFVDPHRDAVGDLTPFYWQDPSRLLLIDLGAQWEGLRLPVYNPLDCRGTSQQEADRRVSGMVGGLAVAAGWDARSTRSVPIATEAVKLLAAVNRALGPEDPVATVFQVPTVLMDAHWRAKLVTDPRIPASIRRWWENEGASYKSADFSPTTQVVSRIRSSVPLTAFLGARSTFTPRQAMDSRMVMLYGGLLSGDDMRDRLAVSLVVRMLIQAAYSRGDIPREIRAQHCPPFWLFVDELPTCDGPDFAKVFMELRKYGIRCQVMGVTPEKFPQTWQTAVTAASIVSTTAIDGAGAAMVAALSGWEGFRRDLGGIEQFHHLTSFTFGGRVHPPIAVKGMQPQDIFEPRPGVVEASIPGNPRYRLVADVIEDLETLDDRLMAAWTRGQMPRRSGPIPVDVEP